MNDDHVGPLLASIDRSLRQMVAILEFAFTDQLRGALNDLASDPKKSLAYQSSTDGRSSRQVATLSGVSDRAIRDWWREWFERGLVEETDVGGRYQRKFDLRRYSGGRT